MPRLTPAEVRLPELSRIAGVPEEDRETRGCGRFEQGCTCSACQDEYFRSYANRRHPHYSSTAFCCRSAAPRSCRAPRQGAGDGEGHGRIAVDTGRADAHALTDQLEQGSESLVEGHEGFKRAELFSRPGPRRLE